MSANKITIFIASISGVLGIYGLLSVNRVINLVAMRN